MEVWRMTNEPTRRHPRLARSLAVLAIAAVAFGAGACGSSKKKTAATSGNGTAGTVITIKDFAFSPTPLKAKPGATITIKNADTTTHTFTADDNSFDAGDIASGGSATVTLPNKAGTVKYHCNIHNSMKGTIQVTA
jgi:plastocyanin